MPEKAKKYDAPIVQQTQQPVVKKKRLGVASDFFSYMRHTGKWWMLPVIVMLLLAGIIIIAGGTTLSPFIYALI